jgi:hypothetical protein
MDFIPLIIEQDLKDLMDERDGLQDFQQSYKSLKSPQTCPAK